VTREVANDGGFTTLGDLFVKIVHDQVASREQCPDLGPVHVFTQLAFQDLFRQGAKPVVDPTVNPD
jgi:hypothetical protein